MSHQQPGRLDEPIKYGDVFPVSGQLAGEPVRPVDASMMQKAENIITGHTQKGGAASIMQSASALNEHAGLVGHGDVTGDPADRGVSVTEIETEGRRIVRESVAGQTVSQFSVPAPAPEMITVGEALERAGIMTRDKRVERSDAAAIQVAEAPATGMKITAQGGLAAATQLAADINSRILCEEDKATIGDVLANVTGQLAADKEVMREMRNGLNLKGAPGGVMVESVTVSAQLNESVAKNAL